MSEEKKIIIDEDWKSQVEAEKESLSKQQPEQSTDESQLPPALVRDVAYLIGYRGDDIVGPIAEYGYRASRN